MGEIGIKIATVTSAITLFNSINDCEELCKHNIQCSGSGQQRTFQIPLRKNWLISKYLGDHDGSLATVFLVEQDHLLQRVLADDIRV